MSNKYKITYFPEENFETADNGAISLRQYPKSTLAVMKGNTILQESKGFSSPLPSSTGYSISDETLNNSLVVNGQVFYHKNNFTDFISGTIQFEVKKEDETLNNISTQEITGYSSDLVAINTDYTLNVKTYTANTSYNNEIVLNFDTVPSLIELVDLINEKYDVDFSEVIASLNEDGTGIKFSNRITDNEIGIRVSVDTSSSTSITTLFDEIGEEKYFNVPENDSNVFSLIGTDDKNSIYFIHKTDGKLWLKMTDYTNTYVLEKELCDWNFTNEEFAKMELAIDSSKGLFFIDGKLINMFEMVGNNTEDSSDVNNIERENPLTYLLLGGSMNSIQGDSYSYKSFAVSNEILHSSKFNTDTLFDTSGSFIELDFGVIKAYSDKSMEINTNDYDFVFSMYDGATLMTSTSSSTEFISFFDDIDYDESSSLAFETSDNFKIRIYFNDNNSVLENINVDLGTLDSNESSDNGYGFEDLFMFIRRSLGYPQVPVELTDEQLMDALDQAVFEYNRYRNFDINYDKMEVTTDLIRADDNSLVLPPNIAAEDIIDIVVKPRFTWAWFGGGNTFMNNVFMQSFFKAGDVVSGASDMYIYRSSLKDVENLMGLSFSWNVMNNRLYFQPANILTENMVVGIKYVQTLSVEEIVNSIEIKKLALAYSKITLGTIRQTFGNSIPAGESTVQLNGDALIASGEALKNEMIEEMYKRQEPLGFLWT